MQYLIAICRDGNISGQKTKGKDQHKGSCIRPMKQKAYIFWNSFLDRFIFSGSDIEQVLKSTILTEKLKEQDLQIIQVFHSSL